MQKKKNISLIKPRDFVIGIFCLSGMGISLFFFWKDLNISLAKKNEQPIAIIYFKRNTAQRRLLSHNLWERLQQSSKIYDGDRIRTAEYSEAYTVFNDGSTLDLHENSLVQVFKSDKGTNVSFIEGAVSISSPVKSQALTVTSGTKVIKIDADSDITLAQKNNSQIAASVQKGSLIIEDKKQEQTKLQNIMTKPAQQKTEQINNTQKLETGSAILFSNINNDSKNKEIVTSQLSDVTVFMPTSTSSLLCEQGKVPSFPIKVASQNDLIIQFSRDSAFTRLAADCRLPVNSNIKYISLPFAKQEDTLFWRIIPENNKPATAPISSGVIFIHGPENKSLTEVAAPAFGEKQAEKVTSLLQSSNISHVSQSVSSTPKKSLPDTVVATIIETEPKASQSQAEQIVTDKNTAEKTAQIAAAKKAADEKKAAELAAAKKADEKKKAAELAAAQKKAVKKKKTAELAAAKKVADEKKAAELAAAKKAADEKKAAELAAAQKAADEKKAAALIVPAVTNTVASGAAAGALSAAAPVTGAVASAAGTAAATQASASIAKNTATDTQSSSATASSKQVVSEAIPPISDKIPILDPDVI